MSESPGVVILGAGPAGVGAAYRLAASGKARATVLERSGHVGGLASSFELRGSASISAATACIPPVVPGYSRTFARSLATICWTARGTVAFACVVAGSTFRSSRST